MRALASRARMLTVAVGLTFMLSIARPSLSANPELTERWLDSAEVAQQIDRFVRSRVPPLELAPSARSWQREAQALRRKVLRNVVFRGIPSGWRTGLPHVEWLDRLPTEHGYSIRKLRIEVVPGLWIPALLYEPDQLSGKVPVILNVNGHSRNGKVTDYKQIRCINQAKQGMIALNLEWLGMGQLQGEGYQHNNLALLDLCGRSGLGVFFLAMSRGLDVLLEHPHADTDRLAVTGLSGGGWQTIVLSSLDTRVCLAVPVAGHSGIIHRLDHRGSIGDLEQIPSDLVSIADYTQLTAMMVPRPTLLIFNDQDNCCFVAGHVKSNIVDPVIPFFHQAGVGERIRYHENSDPGTHNYDQDNREQFQRFVSRHFLGVDAPDLKEIDSSGEVLSAQLLHVPLPADNATFHSLAREAADQLPRHSTAPTLRLQRAELRRVLRFPGTRAELIQDSAFRLVDEGRVDRYVVQFSGIHLTAAATVIEPEQAQHTVLVVADGGFGSASETMRTLAASGNRVIGIDPLLVGQSAPPDSIAASSMLIATVGERALGIQTAQLLSALEAMANRYQFDDLEIHSFGPRMSLAALCAGALDGNTRIRGVVTTGMPDSLKHFLQPGQTYRATPELYCFGLLELVDIPQLRTLGRPLLTP